MSIANQLNNLIDSLTNTYNILSEMGAIIPSNKNIQNLKPTIDSLPDSILKFKSLEERDSYTGKLNEGDICVVYDNDDNITETGQYYTIKTKDLATIPQTFKFDDSISDSVYVDEQGTYMWLIFADSETDINESLFVQMLADNVSSSTSTITLNAIYIHYTSYDQGYSIPLRPLPGGVGWTIAGQVGYAEEHLANANTSSESNNSFNVSFLSPVHFIPNADASMFGMPCSSIGWVDWISDIFSSIAKLIGFYKYVNGSWVLITDSLTAERKYVYNTKFYGINGVETGILQNNTNLSNEDLLFKSSIYNDITHLSTRYLDDFSYFFSRNYDLTENDQRLNLDTSYGVYMDSMFYHCDNLTTVPNFSTSNVTNMHGMFEYCYNLTTVPNFNTSNVTSMGGMFDSCNSLTTVPNFNTSNVTDMSGMFDSCNNLTTVPNFNTSNVTNMSMMFYNCYNLTTVPNLNTTNVMDMSLMFDSCNNLTTVPNLNTTNVTDMGFMFGDCNNLTAVPNFNTSNVTNMSDMFYNCPNLTTVPNFNTINVTDMYGMFANCYNLTSVPNFNTSNVTSMYGMFSNCRNLTMVPNFDTSNVTNINGMFSNCTNLVNLGGLQNLGQAYTSSTSSDDGNLVLIYSNNLTETSISNILTNLYVVPTKHNVYFADDSLSKINVQDAYAAINNNWNIVNFIPPVDLTYTYINGTSNNYLADTYLSNDEFRQVMYNFNTNNDINSVTIHSLANITNISSLFTNFSALQTVNLSDCSKIISVSNIFTNCSNLTTLDGFNNLGVSFTNDTTAEDRTLDFTTCLNITNISFVNVFNNLSKVSAESHINLGDTNFAKLTEDEIKIPCKKGWTVDGYEYVPTDIWSIPNVVNLNSNSGTYSFELSEDSEGQYAKNTNQNVNSSSCQMSITITQQVLDILGNTLTLNCYYSSESSSYDYLLIKQNETQIGRYGGYNGTDWLNTQVDITISLGDVIYITYSKDSSASSGNDGVKIYIVQ